MKKRFIAVFLTVCMVLGLLPGSARAAEIDGGACGAGLTWSLDNAGVLTISGTGDMYDYSDYSSVPWYSERANIQSVDIAEGMTSIGNYAFYYCSALTRVDIPEGVTSIGKFAFAGCSSLTSVTIPGSVTSMGESVFVYCSGPTSAGPIGSSSDIEFGWTTSIPDRAFQNLRYLTSVIIPDGVTSIGESAFNSCSSLTSVTIPDSVTSIGNSAFAISGLTGIVIPEGVTSIGNSAFQLCSSLTSVTIPGSVTSIGNSAFQLCSSLTSVTIPDGVTSIGMSAFSGCSGLTSVTIPGSVTSMGTNVFQNCSGLTSAGPIDDGNSYSIEFGWTTNIPDYAFYGCTSLTSIIIPEGVTSIGSDVFYGCSSLTSVTIPDSVTSIGDRAFSNCSGLTSVTIPESVTSIGVGAFGGCSGLTSAGPISDGNSYSIEFGWTTSIPNNAFDYCSSLTSVTIPEGVTFIGTSAFSDCSSLTSIIIPDGVTSIGASAFSGCSSLTSVTVPASVTRMGNYAFSNNMGSAVPARPMNDDLVIYYTGTPAGWERIEKETDEYGASVVEGTKICYLPTFDPPQITPVTTDPVVTVTANIAFKDEVDIANDIRVETDANLTLVSATSGTVTRSGDYALTLQFSGTAQEGDELNITVLHTAFSVPVATAADGDIDTVLPAVTVTAEPPETTIVPYPVTGGNIYFDTATGTVVDCDLSVTAADIPAQIAGMDVIAIGAGAFSGCSSLTSVTIPASVLALGENAFTVFHGFAFPALPLNDYMVIYYTGTPDGWDRIEKFNDDDDTGYDWSVAGETPIYYLPTFDPPQISSGTTDPVVTVTADIAFKDEVDIANDIRVETDADLTLVSAASGTVTRSGDYTLTLQFSGTAQEGDVLNITVLHTAFSVGVATAEGPVDTVLSPVMVTAGPPHTHVDADGDGYCDDGDGACLHTMGVDGYCTDASCTHSSGCACGGLPPAPPAPVTPEPDPAPDSDFPAPPPASPVTPEPEPEPEPSSPVVVAVDDTIAAGEQKPVVISGQGESDMQYIVKSGEYVNWIDRLNLPRYAIDLYTVLCIGGDNDTLYDILIKDQYFNFSGSAGTSSGEEANVESVLELVSQMDTPYSSGSGIFGTSSFTGGFDIIDTTAGDRSINYGELKEGDVVRTSSYNGIFVTSVAKDGNKNYDEDLKKACTYANTAFQAFDRDHPEVFWLSGKSKLRMVTVTMSDGQQKYKETYVFFVLADTDGFTVRDSKYSGQDKIEADIQRMEKAVETILSTVTAKTPNEQAAQLNRWLTEHNEYNTSEDLYSLPNWPHECLSALVGSVGKEGPVCDGYSRAFKVLCGRLDIPCVLVDGHAKPSADSAGEFHMWNSAQMPDGKWYGVDVTWNDPTVKGVSGAKSGREREDFLLVGADTVIFGLKFSESHPPKNRAADGGVAFVNGPTLSVEAFKPLAAVSVLPFADVAADSWYYSAVEYVYDHDLMTGESVSAFAPNGAMTRAMVWTVLGRMAGAEVSGGTPWYSGARSWASGAGISDGSNPGGSISREELVTMLWRAQGSPEAAADLSGFADGGSVSAWADGAMRWAVASGLLEGSGGRLNPAGRATRAEVAAILMRYCEAFKK